MTHAKASQMDGSSRGIPPGRRPPRSPYPRDASLPSATRPTSLPWPGLTRVVDALGPRVIPGLNDSYIHLIRGGVNYLLELRWDGVPSLSLGLRMLCEQAERTPPRSGYASWAAGAARSSPKARRVNPTSIYRRWRTREGLLADVAMSPLERDLPVPDTGSLRGDSSPWAASAAADLARPEGRLFLLALITSIPSTPEAQAERDQHLQRRMWAIRTASTDRAAGRGESPPTRARSPTRSWACSTGALWGTLPADPAYASSLVDGLLSPACHNGPNT